MGARVEMVYSPLDAIEIAEKNPEKQVVFLGVGFEGFAGLDGILLIVIGTHQHLGDVHLVLGALADKAGQRCNTCRAAEALSDEDCCVDGDRARG